MTIRRKRIRSCPEEDCERPWVEFSAFTVTATGIAFTVTKATGPAASPECRSVDKAKERLLERARVMPFDPTAILEDGTREPHALAVTLDGELEFVPLSKQQRVYYAHLAFVYPETGDADVFEFEEDPNDRRRDDA